jgi:subtilisin family serine protease
MLGINQMHQEGFRGEGIQIALLDGGFRGVNTVDAFRDLDIRGTYSFVHGRNDVYAEGDHGVRVLSALAGFRNGELVGPAHRASFYLFQTEDERNETRAEEAWWLAAAERADSLGVDIISFSLGYYEFDDPRLNYTRQQLDGRTALITRAANAAAATGMLVFKSAGNAANSSWGALTFPADADSIVVVGAVNQTGHYSSFSSRGPTADGRRKPDVAAQGQGTIVILPGGFLTGSNGTSFATPLAAGLAAGVWQAFPELSARQLADMLRRSGDRANSPNDSTGFGIPHFERIKNLVTSLPEQNDATIHLFPNPFTQRLFIRIPAWMEGQKAEISLHDALGRICLTQTLVLNQTLELFDSQTLEALAQGFYVLKISTPTHQSTTRLSK